MNIRFLSNAELRGLIKYSPVFCDRAQAELDWREQQVSAAGQPGQLAGRALNGVPASEQTRTDAADLNLPRCNAVAAPALAEVITSEQPHNLLVPPFGCGHAASCSMPARAICSEAEHNKFPKGRWS